MTGAISVSNPRDPKTERRIRALEKNSYEKVVDALIDPDTGAGVLIAEYQFGKKRIRAHFYRPRQINTPFDSEAITSNHQRIHLLENLRTRLRKLKEAKRAPHDLKIGEIITEVWGQTMRDVHFYQVIDIPDPRKVTLHRIESRILAPGDWMNGEKVPVSPTTRCNKTAPGSYNVSMETGAPKIDMGGSFTSVRRWDGRPVCFFSD